jgi:hypothetical protein
MEKTLTCACGAVLVARSDEDLLTAVEEHLEQSHDLPAQKALVSGSARRHAGISAERRPAQRKGEGR